MELTHVILGPVVTEKAERLKAEGRSHTLRVAPDATKVEVQNALERHYGVEVQSVRIMHIRPKTRLFGKGQTMEKRHASKRAIVTLAKKSKTLDLSAFQTR